MDEGVWLSLIEFIIHTCVIFCRVNNEGYPLSSLSGSFSRRSGAPMLVFSIDQSHFLPFEDSQCWVGFLQSVVDAFEEIDGKLLDGLGSCVWNSVFRCSSG